LDCRPWNTRHPYVTPIPQGRIEQLLTERLADYDVSVRRGHELTALHPDDDGVTATVRDHVTGTGLDICARYLVACDGGHSAVRKLLRVLFPGQAGTMAAVLADVRLTSISHLVPTSISQFTAMVRDGDGYWSMLNPLEGDLYRLVFGPFERPPPISDATAPSRPTRSATPCRPSGGPTPTSGTSPGPPGSATPPGRSSTTGSAR
jgi:2-polyprenyl-6-methoxyphenol hydroxylase-like FAD-dependent oxidoreductase